MGLFKKKKTKETSNNFDSLVAMINGAKDDDDLAQQAEKWIPDIENCSVDYWVDKIFGEDVNKLNIEKLPIVLDVFYKTTDKFKFMLFCMLLESTIEELPYLTNLENVPLFEAKWETLKNSLCSIIKNTHSALIDCMYLILLKNDPMGEYLSPEEKQDVIDGTNQYLNNIYNYLTHQSEIHPNVYRSLEVALDTACYINDAETKSIIQKLSTLTIDSEALMFLVKYELVNGNAANPAHMEKIMSDRTLQFRFLRILDSLNKLSLMEDKMTQEDIVLARMVDWLIYPTELGKLPTDIQHVSSFEKDNLVYYILKFTTDLDALKDRGYMIGVTGGYEKGKLTTNDTGLTFSEFESITDDYEAQAKKIIDNMMKYWMERAGVEMP